MLNLKKFVSTYVRSFFIYLVFTGIFLLALGTQVQAQGGLGVSGTFAGYHYKLVPGEQLDSENVYASFFNNFSVPIEVQIIYEAPQGVSFIVESDVISIPANDVVRVPIGIALTNMAVPGDYVVTITAQIIPESAPGITAISSAGLNARLSIFGEAGRITVRALTTKGDLFRSRIELFRVEDDGQLFSVNVRDNVLIDRVVIGNYIARAYFEGRTIAEEAFTVNNNDVLAIDLIARTVFVRSFNAEPVFFEDRNILSSTVVSYSLENVYETVNNIQLELVVRLGDEIIDEVEMFLAPVLNVGRTEGRFTYIPPRGWQEGTYQVSIRLYELDNRFPNGQFLYDETSAFTFIVPASVIDGGVNILQVALLAILGLVIVLTTALVAIVVKDRYPQLLKRTSKP
jgi:hypothetical protein